jgi:hypothetical protein
VPLSSQLPVLPSCCVDMKQATAIHSMLHVSTGAVSRTPCTWGVWGRQHSTVQHSTAHNKVWSWGQAGLLAGSGLEVVCLSDLAAVPVLTQRCRSEQLCSGEAGWTAEEGGCPRFHWKGPLPPRTACCHMVCIRGQLPGAGLGNVLQPAGGASGGVVV